MIRGISNVWKLLAVLVPVLGLAQGVAPIWNLPGRTSELIVRDATGGVRDGINSGMVARASYYSATGGAAQVLATLYAPTIASGQSFTAWAWARSANGSAESALFGSNMGSPGAVLDLELHTSGFGAFFSVRDDDSTAADSVGYAGINWRDGNWHFFTGTFDASANTVQLYVDCILRATTSITANSNGRKTFVGGFGLGGITRTNGAPLRTISGDIAATGFEYRALNISEQARLAARWKP